jgi:DNA-binding MarR family transcriptional regulator
MGIEKDLHREGQFRNSHNMVLVNVLFSGIWLQEKMTRLLEPYQLTIQQYNTIKILGRAGTPLTTLQLRHRMMDKMSDTSRIVDRLILKGFLKKTISKKDKRLVDVVLTAKAKKLIKEFEKKLDVKLDALCNNLSETEAKTLNKLLDKMRG